MGDSDRAPAHRRVEIIDVDERGRRYPLIETSEPHVVAAAERALHDLVRDRFGMKRLHHREPFSTDEPHADPERWKERVYSGIEDGDEEAP